MKIFRFLFLLVFVLISTSGNSFAQWDNWFHYTVMNSDLPSNVVNYVEVDRNNIKWIASGPELVRMQNQQMTIISAPPEFGIYELGEIAVDLDDTKWIRSLFNGILKYDDSGNWTQYNQDNGFPGNDTVTAVSIDSNNIVWVGSFDGVSRWDGSEWQHFSGEEYVPHRIINALEVDKDNNLWIGTFGGLVKYDGVTWDLIDTSEYHLPSYYIISLDINVNDELFIGTKAGLAKFDGNEWSLKNPTLDNDKLNNNVWTINALERDLWIGFKYDEDRIAAKFDSTEWFFFGPENSALPPNDMQCIAVDDSNHVFFATYRGGLVEFWDDRGYRDSSNLLVADFLGVPRTGYSPLEVDFTDLSTGNPTSWNWTFGDGESSTQKNPTHIYNSSGTYTVSLAVANINSTDTLIKEAYIVVHPSIDGSANFTCNPLKGCIPLPITFTDRSTGSPISWDWDFGDGSSSSLQHPVHTYTDPGVYSIYLTVEYDGYESTHGRINFIEVLDCDSVMIELYTPFDGAEIYSGTVYPVTWNVAPNINYVNIWLSTNNGSTWEQIADNIEARPEHLTWQVPNIVAPYCLMKIEDYDNPDINDINTFAIIAGTTDDGKDTLKVCSDWDGREIQTSFRTDPTKIYRLTFQGTYSLHDRLNACPNEGDLSCGFDAAYVYDIEDRAVTQGKWPPESVLSLVKPFTDTTSYDFAGNKTVNLFDHTGFRFNGFPLNVEQYNASHQYIIERQGTGDFFKFSIIDSMIIASQILEQYEDNDDCISIIIEETDSVEVDYCGFEFIRDSVDSNIIIGMQLDAGIFVRDTMSIIGKRNILGEIEPEELGIVINGKFVCPIDSIVCDDVETSTELPVSFGLVVDRSTSMSWEISDEDSTIRMHALKSALTGFVNNMRDDDQAFLMSFGNDVRLDQDWTNNKSLLNDKINNLVADGWTKVWGAIDESVDKMIYSNVPRAMIVLSDGANKVGPYLERMDLLNKISSSTDLPIYIIALGLTDNEDDIKGKDSLNMIAEASGGKLFEIDDSDGLSSIYEQILQAETTYECCRIYFSGDIDSCGWVKLIYSPERDDIITRAFDYCGREIISTMIRDAEESEMQMKVSPNPVSETAKVEYNLSHSGSVTITVTDMMGRKLLDIDTGYKSSGNHTYYVDGTKLQSGTYIATVRSSGETLSRKVVVIH